MKMPLTTTLTELNRLYGAYADAAFAKDTYAAHKIWVAYMEYLRVYNLERGLPTTDRHGMPSATEPRSRT